MKQKMKLYLVLVFALLLLPNLGVRTLWQDEAETALVAKVVLARGLPYAIDEEGPISQDWNYQFSVSPLWRWHPWLQFYIAAASFRFLGVNAFSARLPFALIGVLSYWYFLRFLRTHGPKDKIFFAYAALMMLLSVPLLLHLRQARYYSLSLLFTLITLDGYLRSQAGRPAARLASIQPSELDEKRYSLRYIVGGILLFHSFLPGALALQASLLIDSLYRRWKTKQSAIPFMTSLLLTLLFTLPWAVWLKIGGQNLNFTPTLIAQHLKQHYLYIHKFIVPFYFILPFLIPRVRKAYFRNQKLIVLSLIIAVNIVLYTVNHPYFFRYLVPLIPLFAYLTAWILWQLPWGAAAAGVIILTAMVYKTLPGYVYEISHPYVGSNERLVSFVNSLDQKTYRSLAVNYDDFTFRFHTDLTVYGAQQIPSPSFCPELVFIFPQWGNEETLRTLARSCRLDMGSNTIPFVKLADDPNPLTHQFRPPTTGSVELFLPSR